MWQNNYPQRVGVVDLRHDKIIIRIENERELGLNGVFKYE